MVDISIGSSEAPFRLPRGLLCRQSGFFHAAFRGDFKEVALARLALLDVEPLVFPKAVKWMYQGHLNDSGYERHPVYRKDGPGSYRIQTINGSRKHFHSLLETYYLAEKLCMDVLKQQICGRLGHVMNNTLNPPTLAPSTISNAYQFTSFTTMSPLWGWICGQLACQFQGAFARPIADYQECFDTIPGLAVRIMSQVPKVRAKVYYTHEEFVRSQM